jgi:hypothetical protein
MTKVMLALGVMCASGWLLAQTAPPVAPTTVASTAPTTQPTTRPGRQSAEEMLSQMLRPTTQSAVPLKPIADGGGGIINHNTGPYAVIPGAPTLHLIPEGSLITDKIARLTKTDDGKAWEVTFESDGQVLQDPPMRVLPNKNLTRITNALMTSNADLRFRVSGEVTEFDNRNYLLIQKAAQVSELTNPLK